MKVRKKTKAGKYTIGPHGEIYNNEPEFSERTKKLIETMVMKEALEEAFEEMNDEEVKEDASTGDSQTGDEVVCD